MPRLIEIISEPELFGKRDIPTGVLIEAGASAFGRKEIVVIRSVQLHSEPPLLEVVQANDIARFCFCFVERRKNQRHQNGNDRDGDQQFDQAEPVRN